MKIKICKVREVTLKCAFTVCLGLWVTWVMVFLFSAEAAEKKELEHIPTEKIIEFSLLNLKENLQKTIQKNEQLTFENVTLRKDINYLRRILESLAVEKSQLSGQPLSFYYPKGQNHTGEVIDMKDRQRRTQELINHFERDTWKLKEEIRLIENKLDKNSFDSQRKLLIKSKESNRKNLLLLEKKLKLLKNNSKGPLNTIESLKVNKRVLEQEISDLERSIHSF